MIFAAGCGPKVVGTDNFSDYPEVVKRLLALAEKAREELGDGNRPGKGQRPAGHVPNPKPILP